MNELLDITIERAVSEWEGMIKMTIQHCKEELIPVMEQLEQQQQQDPAADATDLTKYYYRRSQKDS